MVRRADEEPDGARALMPFDHTFKVPEQVCPKCGATLHAATAADHDNSPAPGMITVCAGCAALLQFAEGLLLELMTAEQIAALPADLRAELEQMQRVIRTPRGPGGRAGYAAAMRKMALAAVAWVERRGVDGLAFTLPPDDGMMFIAPLGEDAIEMLGANDKTRDFLRALDAATGHEATAFLACQVVRAMNLPVTDWSADFWQELLASGTAILSTRGAHVGKS